jgi:hypothetical protein
VLQTQEWSPSMNVKFNNAAEIDTDPADTTIQRITSPFNIYKNVFIPDGLYAFSRHHIAYTSAQDRRVTFNVSERFGPFYSGSLNELSFRANYRPTARFSASVGDTWNSFRIPVANGNFAVHLASTQANYSFSRFLSFTALLHMDTANIQALSANIRLRYNYRSDSDFYIIYNQGTRFASLTATNPAQLRDQRIEAKFTYSFQPRFGRLGHSEWPPAPARLPILATVPLGIARPRPTPIWILAARSTQVLTTRYTPAPPSLLRGTLAFSRHRVRKTNFPHPRGNRPVHHAIYMLPSSADGP